MNDVAIGIDVDPERGSADSGDLEVDPPNLFVAIGEARRIGAAPWQFSSTRSSTLIRKSSAR